MQLSAPSLPFDPISTLPESSGQTARRQSTGGEPKRTDAFGEILSGKSARHAGRGADGENRSTNRSHHQKHTERNIDASEREETKDVRDLNRDRPKDGRQVDELQTDVGAVASSASTQPPAHSELSLFLQDGFAAPSGASDAEPPVAGGSDDGRSAQAPLQGSFSATPQGKPFLGEVTTGKAQATYRAFGLNAERVAANKAEGRAPNSAPPFAGLAVPIIPNLSGPVSGILDDHDFPLGSGESQLPVTAGMPVSPVMEGAIPDNGDVLEGLSDPLTQVSDTVAASELRSQPLSGTPHAETVDGTSDLLLATAGTEQSPAALDDSASMTAAIENVGAASLTEASADSMDTADSFLIGSMGGETDVDAKGTTKSGEPPPPEKIAPLSFRSPERVASVQKANVRTSLYVADKELVDSYGRIGINVAKPDSPMSASVSTSNPAPVLTVNPSVGVAPISFDARVTDSASQPPAHVEQAARRAVESALAVAEQFAPGEQRSVRLQFSVGGEDLAVRVELRGDQVHTTFRTDSSELRTALAREWQTVSATQSSERGQRLADPVFASSSSGQSLSSDSGAAQQRDPQSRQAQLAAHDLNQMRRVLHSPSVVDASAATSSAPRAQPSTSLRLHTFA